MAMYSPVRGCTVTCCGAVAETAQRLRRRAARLSRVPQSETTGGTRHGRVCGKKVARVAAAQPKKIRAHGKGEEGGALREKGAVLTSRCPTLSTGCPRLSTTVHDVHRHPALSAGVHRHGPIRLACATEEFEAYFGAPGLLRRRSRSCSRKNASQAQQRVRGCADATKKETKREREKERWQRATRPVRGSMEGCAPAPSLRLRQWQQPRQSPIGDTREYHVPIATGQAADSRAPKHAYITTKVLTGVELH
eukprot:356427-Chlamydomonas_euryale.AAC.9